MSQELIFLVNSRSFFLNMYNFDVRDNIEEVDRQEWIDQCISNQSHNRLYKDADGNNEKSSLDMNIMISYYNF